MGRTGAGKWVMHQTFLDRQKDAYIYKRPATNRWQYFLSIKGEGEERKSTGVDGDPDDIEVGKEEALDVLQERKLEVKARHQQGLKARRVKKLFDFMDDFLEEEKQRIATHNKKGMIVEETFRLKSHHLNLLKKFYKLRSIKLEDLNYGKLYEYPTWRTKTVDPRPEYQLKPPKRNHTILTELTTIKAYFAFLLRKGYISREPDFASIQRESMKVNRRDFLSLTQYTQTLNTVRKWYKSKSTTPTQKYNREMIYLCLLIMANSSLRKGELKGLKWGDLEPNTNLDKEDQKVGHLIRVRAEVSKTGEPRTVQTPTVEYFDRLRTLQGIKKKSGAPFPHIPLELRDQLVLTKYNHPDEPLGLGTWNQCWKQIKELCAHRYWGDKNITYYSFRHTAISFAVQRQVPLLQLARNSGTGIRYVEQVYYHHEAESKKNWETLMKNRKFYDVVSEKGSSINMKLEDALGVDV